RSEYFTIEGITRNEPTVSRQATEEGLGEPTDRKASSRDRWYFPHGLCEYRNRLEQEPLSLFPFAIHKFIRLWYGMETGMFYRQLILGICSLLVVPMGILQIWFWRRDHVHLSII